MYINLPKELDHPRKCLINIPKINDKECFKRCLAIDLHPRWIKKVGKLYQDKLDFKGIKFAVKVRDIHKIERKSSICINVLKIMKIRKNIQSVCQKTAVKINYVIYYW